MAPHSSVRPQFINMNALIVLTVLVASAVAAPQAIRRPAYSSAAYPYSAAPAAYPFGVSAAPAAYSFGAAPYAARPYAAPFATAPAYAAPVAPAYRPAAYAAPVAPAYRPAAYAAPVAPAYRPAAYAAPAYSYAPQPAYAGAAARPIAIVRQAQDNNFDGTFNSEFESENGISSSSSGYVKAISPEETAQVIQGQYAYTAPDGTPIVTRYYADENGFHAEGAHIPVAPVDPYRIA